MDKKTVLAIALIFLVVMTYQLLILPKVEPPPVDIVTAPAEETLSVPVPTEPPPPPAATTAAPALLPPPSDGSGPGEISLPETAEPRTLTVDRPLFKAAFNNNRGGLLSWNLSEYLYGKNGADKTVEGKPLELVKPGTGHGSLGITFVDPSLEQSFSTPMAVTEVGDRIILSGSDPYGLKMSRSYSFSEDGYVVDMEFTAENTGDSPRTLSWEINWGPGLDKYHTASSVDRVENMSYAFGEIDREKVKNPGERKDFANSTWMGIGNRYFLAALIAREGVFTGFLRKTASGEDEVGLQAIPLTITPRQVIVYRVSAYIGPKERERLAEMGVGLEESVNYGWFSWLALPFLSILKFFFSYLHNWGLAIIALTVLVKGALFPITQTMYRSMRKMQTLQPKIQAIKKKYKDDTQAVQRETMALYKEHKVNPMGGCLPMFVQLPVFFALYRVLWNAIELRGAGFLYIPDLSQKDPYYIAPLLMGATMIIQQRLSPTTIDPKQAKMMMFMPVIFTAMFLNFSAGLVVYFLFSNILAIGEQYFIRRVGAGSPPAQQPTAVPKKLSGKKKNK